eukprot:2790173-Pleurochrysis_carterae.AAC.2
MPTRANKQSSGSIDLMQLGVHGEAREDAEDDGVDEQAHLGRASVGGAERADGRAEERVGEEVGRRVRHGDEDDHREEGAQHLRRDLHHCEGCTCA